MDAARDANQFVSDKHNERSAGRKCSGWIKGGRSCGADSGERGKLVSMPTGVQKFDEETATNKTFMWKEN